MADLTHLDHARQGTAWHALGRQNAYWLLVLPALVLLVGFYIYPIGTVMVISVTEPRLGMDNYLKLFTSGALQRMLWTTTRICVITTVVTMLIGYLIAYAVVHVRERQHQWMLFCVLLSFWISVLVRAFSWLVLLKPQGPINQALLALGVIDTPLDLVRNEIGVVIGIVHYMIPYAVFPLYANMKGIDQQLVRAARGLGATAFGAFTRVFLPLSVPGIIGAGILVFIFSLGFFVTPAILGGGRTTMISEYISIQIIETLQWGLASMLATSMLLTVFLMIAIMSRFVNVRQMFGAS
jgi:putative spermidine/putrescine transport system permease protein